MTDLLSTLPKRVDDRESYTLNEIAAHVGIGINGADALAKKKVAEGAWIETTKKVPKGTYVRSFKLS